MIKFEVGAPFPLFAKSKKRDGAVLELFEDGSYCIAICLSDMTTREKSLIQRGRLGFRIFEDPDTDFLITLIRLGETDSIFEIAFDPTLYKDERANPDLYEISNALYIFGIESTNTILKCIRLVSVPSILRNKWLKSWDKMRTTNNCSEKYCIWISSLYAFDLKTLWNCSTPIETV